MKTIYVIEAQNNTDVFEPIVAYTSKKKAYQYYEEKNQGEKTVSYSTFSRRFTKNFHECMEGYFGFIGSYMQSELRPYRVRTLLLF